MFYLPSYPQVDETFNKEWQRAISQDPDAASRDVDMTQQTGSEEVKVRPPDTESGEAEAPVKS